MKRNSNEPPSKKARPITTGSKAGFQNKPQIDELLGLMIFGCNLPFTIVESVHFISFVNALDPNYKIPCRQTVASSILDKCYFNAQARERCQQTEKATLISDGWKNDGNQTKLIVTMAKIRSTGKEILIKSYDLSADKVDSDKVK